MKYKWLNKQNNDKLIIFFNGWGMDENAVSHLECDDFDVVEFHDYNNLSTDIILNNYRETHLVAWSMGVGVNGYIWKNIVKDYNSATAICGTPYPINDKYGIPEKIYNLTIKRFSENSADKFIKRMFMGNTDKIVTKRSLESMKTELTALLKYDYNNDFHYTKAIIPNNDLIIPTKNQKNYWETVKDTEIIITDTGHYPFLLYNSWSELI